MTAIDEAAVTASLETLADVENWIAAGVKPRTAIADDRVALAIVKLASVGRDAWSSLKVLDRMLGSEHRSEARNIEAELDKLHRQYTDPDDPDTIWLCGLGQHDDCQGYACLCTCHPLAALTADLRAEHPRHSYEGSDDLAWCGYCRVPWPCPTVATLDRHAPDGGTS